MPRYTDIDKLVAEYDRVHVGPAGGARKLMVEAPIADVAPRAEVAREIFGEIYAEIFEMLPLKVFRLIDGAYVEESFESGKERALHDVIHCVAELEKKYTEGQK